MLHHHSRLLFTSLALFTLALSACGGDDEPFALVGSWANNFGSDELITETAWDRTTIVEFDNDARWVITQNPADDMFNPSKFNKIVWTQPEGERLYYCWVDFGLDTAEAAKASTKTADASSPATGGCGGFAWTRLQKPIEIAGTWTSSFGGNETVTSYQWGGVTVVEYDNGANWAVTQNAEDAEFNPGKFNKIVWTEPEGGRFYYCWVDFGKDTAAEAKASTNTADASDPETSGCGGFPWTRLAAQ